VARGNDLSFRPGQRLTVGSCGRRHRPPPGDAGQMPRCPGLAPSRIRRWCAHGVPAGARDRVRAGCDTRPGTRRWPGSPHPGHRAVGMMPAQPSPAPSPPWPGSDGAALGIPGAAGTAWPSARWTASVPLRVAISPHRASEPCPDFFESWCSSWSPVTESNRRPSPYHAYRFRPMSSGGVGLPQVGGIVVSGCVVLRPALPGGVVTWFVTVSGLQSNRQSAWGNPNR
jgi:hypothetical protein